MSMPMSMYMCMYVYMYISKYRMEADIQKCKYDNEASLYYNFKIEVELLRGEGILQKGRFNKEAGLITKASIKKFSSYYKEII